MAKVDTEEIYAPIRERATLVVNGVSQAGSISRVGGGGGANDNCQGGENESGGKTRVHRMRGAYGNATASVKHIDLDADGKLDDVYTDHAWCVCLAGSAAEGRPRYAIAVVLDEYGGTAGLVSLEDLLVLKMLWRRAKDIADVYALRADFVRDHPDIVEGLVAKTPSWPGRRPSHVH